MFLEYFWIILCLFALASSKIIIRDIAGPSWLKLDPEDKEDSSNEFTLDCDYDASSNDTDIEVKWFYNGLEEQIYQWISGENYRNNPSIVGSRFRKHIDTSYSVLDDGIPSFRALKLINVDPTLSGNYTCKVSSFISEHQMTKQVVIYSPAERFETYYLETETTIICNAINVAPKPKFEITIVGKNNTEIERPEDFVYTPSEDSEDGVYYNMSINLLYNSTSLPEESVRFVCRIEIPGTNYTREDSVEHVNSGADLTSDVGDVINRLNSSYKANSSSAHWPPVFLLMSLIISIFCVK